MNQNDPFFPDYLGVNDIGGIEPGTLSATYEDPVTSCVPGSPIQLCTPNGVQTDAGIDDFLPDAGEDATSPALATTLDSKTYPNLTEIDTGNHSVWPDTSQDTFDTFDDMFSYSSKVGSVAAVLSIGGSPEPTTHSIQTKGSDANISVNVTAFSLLLVVLGTALIFLLIEASEDE